MEEGREGKKAETTSYQRLCVMSQMKRRNESLRKVHLKSAMFVLGCELVSLKNIGMKFIWL